MSKKMTPGFALFNSHVNNAKDRALQELRDMGCGPLAEKIEAIEAEHSGIMAVMGADVPMEDRGAVGIFLGLVCAFVNENRDPVS